MLFEETDVSDLRITIGDCMSAGHCVRGVKRWFESEQLDFKLFLAEGIDAPTFLRSEDAHAQGIVRNKIKRTQR